jgi:hypothetical protein
VEYAGTVELRTLIVAYGTTFPHGSYLLPE